MKDKYTIITDGIKIYPCWETAEEVLLCIIDMIRSRWDIELDLDKIDVYYGNKKLRMNKLIKKYVKKQYVQVMKYGRLIWVLKSIINKELV